MQRLSLFLVLLTALIGAGCGATPAATPTPAAGPDKLRRRGCARS
jgi:hypothetical protein